MKKIMIILVLLSLLLIIGCSKKSSETADLILKNGKIYTMDEAHPWASSLIIKSNKIIAVLAENEKVSSYIGERTKVIDLKEKFVLPGFIDGHIHFNRAGALIVDVNLMKVATDDGLTKEIKRVVDSIEDGEWITGGIWGAYEQWGDGAEGSENKNSKDRWKPNRSSIDSITEKNPCFLDSFDKKLYLANKVSLQLAGLLDKPEKLMELDKKGIPTGLIYEGSPAIGKIKKIIKNKSSQRLIKENLAALEHLAKCGVVEVHDIEKPDQTQRFLEIEKSGKLTCRIWLRPDLSRGEELIKKGLKMGVHPQTGKANSWLRYGALKGYIDGIMGTHGALFFEPYSDQPDNFGHYRRHTSDDPKLLVPNLEKMYKMIKIGYDGGFVSNVHAIGTKGVSLMLDTYEKLKSELNIDLKGFRVIHAQVIRPADFARFKKLNVIAEINPYHVSDDMRWMEERIGHERAKGAYAFKSLLKNGAMLSFGSDWPGTSAAEYYTHPKYLIHAAVNRTTLNGKPEGGWFPEEKISVHEALKAYTINNAYAAFEEQTRGSLKTGKLADITVIDRNLLEIPTEDILKMNILMTIVDGKIVYKNL